MNYNEMRKQILAENARAARRTSWPKNTRYLAKRFDCMLMIFWSVQTGDGRNGVLTAPAEIPFYSDHSKDVLSLTEEDRLADDWELEEDPSWDPYFGREIQFCASATRDLE